MARMREMDLGGRRVAVIGQGTWNMGDEAGRKAEEMAALRRGVELGMVVVDTAEMYGGGRSERLVGEAIGPVREEVYLVSKVLPSNASRTGTVRACEASLKRLGTDRLELYLLHWTGSHPVEETVAGFEELKAAGKIREWGVSNFDVEDMEELFAVTDGRGCAANQVLYNPEHRGVEFDLLPWCESHSVGVMGYSPVGQGGGLLRSKVLEGIARRHGATAAQVAMAWELRQANVCVIPKAGTVGHVEENAGAARLEMTAEDVAEMDRAWPAPRQKVRLDVL